MTVLFTLFKIALLITPISDLLGLINLQDGLFMKSDLWSFRVMKDSVLNDSSILSSSPSRCAILLSVDVIWLGTLLSVFLLVFVTCFCQVQLVFRFGLAMVSCFVYFYVNTVVITNLQMLFRSSASFCWKSFCL